jgi:hypothetical protein
MVQPMALGKKPSQRPSRTRTSRLRRLLVAGALLGPAAVLGLWIAVHRLPWLGPLLADSLRKVVGADAVSRLEEIAYGAQDGFNRVWRRGEQPRSYWEVPSAHPPASASSVASDPAVPALPRFCPKNVGPVHKSWSAPGDGVWVPIYDPRHPNEDPILYKTLLHPDPYRSWAEVFVVAVDLRRAVLHVMAGAYEPKSFEPEGKKYKRIAKIPPAQYADLLAAFNGGFKTEHGYHGMWVDGVVLVKPREHSCTVALYQDGSVNVGPWPKLKPTLPEMRAYRQSARCMVERGKLHPGLVDPKARTWGATLDGETVIRRSAIGLNTERTILFASITNNTTARALALGLRHAGATAVAQLDVNWSYPKFVTFEPGEDGTKLYPIALAEGFEFSEDEYLRKRSHRDFFYLTRRAVDPRTASNYAARPCLP